MADDLNFNISAQYAEAAAAFTSLGNDVDTFKRKLEELDRAGANPKLTAEASDLATKLIKAKADLDKLNAQKASPKVDLDIAAEEAKLLQVKARLDELNAKKSTAKVDADIAAGLAKMAIIEQRIRDLKDAKANVDLDIAAAEAKVAVLEAELAALGDKHITIDVDTKDGAAKVRELSSAVDSFAGIMSARMGLIATSIMPVLSSIGQLSGALGLIPAVATGAGAALATVVIGTQGMGEALKASEKATKAQEAATKADAAAQRDAATATQAGTAAGTGNIAVLKQAVAEGAAHVAQLKAQKAAGQDVTTELKAAETAQAGNVAALKTAEAAYSGNTSAAGAYSSAQKTANSSAAAATAAHKAAAKAADEQAAAMKNLAPAAQGVVSAIIQLGPAFTDLRMDVQQHLFEGMKQVLLDMANTALPVIKTGLSQMADAINKAMKNVGEFIQQQSSISAWREIFANIGTAASKLADAVKPILQIITDVTKVGSQFLPQLAQHFAEAAQRAADFVSNAEKTGQLHEWIQTGIDAVKLLWGAFKDVVAIIKDLAASPGFGPNFLEALKAVTGFIRWVIENIPIAKTAVQLFFEAWLFAKIVSGIGGMITTIGGLLTSLGLIKVAAGEAALAEAGVGTAASGLLGPLALLAVATLAAFSPEGQAALMKFRDGLDSLLGTTRNASGQVTGFGDASDGARGAIDRFLGVTRNADGVVIGFGGAMKSAGGEAKSVEDAIHSAMEAVKRDIADLKPIKFDADTSSALTGANAVVSAILGIPLPPIIAFKADPGPPIAAAATVTNAILGIPIPVPVVFGGDPSGATTAAGEATAGINSVPTDHNTAINGDPAGATGAAGTATDAIDSVPGSHETAINATDHASPIIQYVAGLLNTIHDVTSTITTIYRTVTGGAEGHILSPMEIGGIAAMASGGSLTRMAAGSAQVVPPNTWRVIGDNMSSDEAYIPINQSGRSQAILGETANRMGYALMKMASGGIGLAAEEDAIAGGFENPGASFGPGVSPAERFYLEMGANARGQVRGGYDPASALDSILGGFENPGAGYGSGVSEAERFYLEMGARMRSEANAYDAGGGQGGSGTAEHGGRGGRRGHGWHGGHGGDSGVAAVPNPDDRTHLAFGSYVNPKTANVTSGYQTAVGAASITRSQPWHASPWTSAERGSGPPPPVIHIHPGGSGIDQMFMKWLREAIRVQGGLQLAFGR